jgi:hypothetical protein
MGIKFIKKLYTTTFQKIVIEDYLDLKSINRVAIKNNITTRQVINILNDNSISHCIKRKIYLDEDYFNKIDDQIIGPDVMYWLGFITADGNVMNKQETKSYFLTIKLSLKDIVHLQKIQNCLKSNAKIKIINTQKDLARCVIVFNSKYLVNSLKKYNIIPNKKKIYEFPSILIHHKFINSFIRGYFDGDGSVSIKNNSLRLNFYGTQNCIDNLSKIISYNCKLSIHNMYNNKNLKCIEYSGKEAVVLIKWLYNDANVYLNRKYNLINDFIK